MITAFANPARMEASYCLLQDVACDLAHRGRDRFAVLDRERGPDADRQRARDELLGPRTAVAFGVGRLPVLHGRVRRTRAGPRTSGPPARPRPGARRRAGGPSAASAANHVRLEPPAPTGSGTRRGCNPSTGPIAVATRSRVGAHRREQRRQPRQLHEPDRAGDLGHAQVVAHEGRAAIGTTLAAVLRDELAALVVEARRSHIEVVVVGAGRCRPRRS